MNNDHEPTVTQSVEVRDVNPILNGPKRQHFLPKFYLEGFTRDGKIAVFDRELDQIRVQQPLNTCVIGHFYTFEDAEGRKRFELEQFLSEYETKASLAIKKLSAKEVINADERSDLAIFIALAACRTPDIVDSLKKFNSGLISDMAKRMFADVEQVKEQMRGKPHALSTEKELEEEAQEIVNFVKSGQWEVKTNHIWAVRTAIQMALTIAPILAGRDWTVIHRDNDKKSFVTTDAPVLLTSIVPRGNGFWEKGIGFGCSDALVLFPLDQTCLLTMSGSDGNMKNIITKSEQIRHINLALSNNCQRFVIGRDEKLVQSLTDYLCLVKKKWRPKMQRME
jgi:hypothetical protein